MDNKPYVFISYAHANSDKVLPTVSAMKAAGINLWFDEGIVAGSEWPEFIAEKVVDCNKFVLFVSNAYLNSQNCKRELNFAISRKKDILSIFLEEVQLSPGMEMQLGTYQAIYRNRFESDRALISSMCKEPFFNPCRLDGAAPAPTPTPQPAPKPTPSPYSQTHTPVTPLPVVPTPAKGPDWNGAVNGAMDSFKDLFGGKSGSTHNATGSTHTTAGSTGYGATAPAANPKNRYIAALLALFLGAFGAQHFYMGNKLWGIVSLVFFWTYIPSFIGFYHAIRFFLMTDSQFQSKCNNAKASF